MNGISGDAAGGGGSGIGVSESYAKNGRNAMATLVEPPVAVKTKGRILIVDDELVVRDSLSRWFNSEGYAARPAASAREALETVAQAELKKQSEPHP